MDLLIVSNVIEYTMIDWSLFFYPNRTCCSIIHGVFLKYYSVKDIKLYLIAAYMTTTRF